MSTDDGDKKPAARRDSAESVKSTDSASLDSSVGEAVPVKDYDKEKAHYAENKETMPKEEKKEFKKLRKEMKANEAAVEKGQEEAGHENLRSDDSTIFSKDSQYSKLETGSTGQEVISKQGKREHNDLQGLFNEKRVDQLVENMNSKTVDDIDKRGRDDYSLAGAPEQDFEVKESENDLTKKEKKALKKSGQTLDEYNQSMKSAEGRGKEAGDAVEPNVPARDENFSIASDVSNKNSNFSKKSQASAKDNIIETDGKSLDSVLQAARESSPDNSRGR